MEKPNTLDCGHAPTPTNSIGTGYGVDATNRTHCYDCCAILDREQMMSTGRIALYLVTLSSPRSGHDTRTREITNWPGTLRFTPLAIHKGRHNIARTRYDVWFNGPDKLVWHGVQYGEDTQILHCRRTKESMFASPQRATIRTNTTTEN